MSRRNAKVVAGGIALVAALAYLRDPPWLGNVTSGMREWDYSESGTVFRWTAGRASLFIPSDAKFVMIPLRSGIPGPLNLNGEVPVEIRVDGRFLATIRLTDPAAWVRQELPLGNRVTHRRFRRVDLHVPRAVGQGNLGVMTGPPTIW
jgi:hypothetical protein